MVESSNGKKSNISLKRDVVLCKSVEIFIFIVRRRNGFCVFNHNSVRFDFHLSDNRKIVFVLVFFFGSRFSFIQPRLFLQKFWAGFHLRHGRLKCKAAFSYVFICKCTHTNFWSLDTNSFFFTFTGYKAESVFSYQWPIARSSAAIANCNCSTHPVVLVCMCVVCDIANGGKNKKWIKGTRYRI